MTLARFQLQALDLAQDRTGFASTSEALNRYFQQQIGQDVRRRVAACFVALQGVQVAGYYTLSAASVSLADLPVQHAKRLPRYPSVPVVRMGRLAVDQTFSGQGLGGALLADALARASNADIGAYALLVDAKDAQAADFYRHHGFLPLNDAPLQWFLPLATVHTLR